MPLIKNDISYQPGGEKQDGGPKTKMAAKYQ